MMRKISSFLLVLTLGISIVGCGNASAISESSNANTKTADYLPDQAQPISNTTVTDTENVSTETNTTVSEPVSEPVPEPEQNFSGSLYTLPVGAKGEEWTEAQIDEYVKDCKALLNNYKPSEKGGAKIDLDAFMADFGFEYVDSFEKEPYAPYNVYWRESGGIKMAAQFDSANHLDIYIDTGNDSVCVMIGNYSNRDQNIRFRSSHLSGNGHFNKMSTPCFKSYAAVLKALTESNNFDCGRLPFPSDYQLICANGNSFRLQKKIEPYTVDFEFERRVVYPD